MKKALFIVLFLGSCLTAMAGAVEFTAKISHSVVEVGQRFQVTFTVNSQGGDFTPPAIFSKFQRLSGPNQSQNMQYVNGRVSQSTSISYVFSAPEKGTFTIGPAKIKVNGKYYKTKSLELKVVAASNNSQNAQRNRQDQRKSDGTQLKDYVFLKSFVDKKKAYVGEKVTVTYKLYSKLNLTGINLEAQPALNGFWNHDLRSLYDRIQLKREEYNGEIYNVAELQQTLLYPQRSGELIIDPMAIKATVQVQSRRARSLLEQMFGSYENKEIITKSKPHKVKVLPLPNSGKPTDYQGAVGEYRMKMSASKDSVEANEAIDIKIEISGNGNIPLIGAPKLNFPTDFEVYDPETKDNISFSYNGASGQKSFNYLVIPRHSGSFKLSPFIFTYFDLKSKSYKSIKADPITIQVGKGSDEANVVFSPNRKEEVVLLNTDIRYIHTKIPLLSAADAFYESVLFYSLVLVAIILIATTYFLSKKLKIRNADTIGMRKSKANKLAKKRLAKAKSYLDTGDKAGFYEEISIALHGYFADKFNISVADLSQDRILELLGNEEATEAIRSEVSLVLEEAEMARFAPESSINTTFLYEKSANIIRKMEDLNP